MHPELTPNCPVGLLPPASQWFEEVRCGQTIEPPRTHSKLPCRSAYPCITVVRGGSVGSNNRPVGLLPQEEKWLEDVWCGRTTLKSLETAL